MCFPALVSLERSRRQPEGVFLFCSVNGRFLNGYYCIIILFWKNKSLKIVKMFNKRTNVRVCSVTDLLSRTNVREYRSGRSPPSLFLYISENVPITPLYVCK